MNQPPRIAVTVGDPAGIGPEIVARAVAALAPRAEAGELALTVIGDAAVQRAATAALGLSDLLTPDAPDRPAALRPGLALHDVGPARAAIVPGSPSAETGRLAYAAIERAVAMAVAGEATAICTGPISKDALNSAGHPFAGHTELLAHLTGARDSVMMLAHGAFRVSHLTTHTALAEVPAKLTPARLRRVVALTDEALRRLDVARPRIGVAALNPHGGEGGLFGREDIDVTTPTLAALRAEGFDVTGPHPGDTVFVNLRAGRFDAVVAMYHDQGHIPVKLLGFSVDPATGRWEALSGVNVTLGLPILRTSVDHGTAFDIAGQGVASAQSLIEAIDFALRMAPGRESAAA